MKNPNIAKVLKEYRKQNHYSVEDVVFKLEEQNLPFATKTIYGLGWTKAASEISKAAFTASTMLPLSHELHPHLRAP